MGVVHAHDVSERGTCAAYSTDAAGRQRQSERSTLSINGSGIGGHTQRGARGLGARRGSRSKGMKARHRPQQAGPARRRRHKRRHKGETAGGGTAGGTAGDEILRLRPMTQLHE